MNIAFIGYGNMAKAIAHGLIKQNKFNIYAASPSLKDGQNKDGVKTNFDNRIIASKADVLILAVKPMQMAHVLDSIKDGLKTDCLIISVAAGITLDWLEAHCPPKQAIIRSMPNTPAEISESATALISNSYTSNQDKNIAEAIFSSIGMFKWIEDEKHLDVLTALAGSGPAYVFKFMESMIEAAESLGLDQQNARAFTLQTFKGAVNLAIKSELTISDLRKKVTSPKGTTAAALDILCQGELDDIILSAMTAAQMRAKELGSTT